jgi:hypothetical protein
VKITVVGCCPEKIKKKIYCKGGRTVTCIQIIKRPDPEPTKQETVAVVNITIVCNHFCCQQYLHIVMYLVEGQSVIYGEMVVVVAEVCAEVHMFVKTNIPRRHAQSCKGKSNFRRPMVWVNVQHQPLDSNPVVMMGLSVVVFIISSLLCCCCCFDLFHLARWCTTLCPASIFKSTVTVFPLLMASYMFGQQIWEALLPSLCFLCAILSLYGPFGWMLSSRVLYIYYLFQKTPRSPSIL